MKTNRSRVSVISVPIETSIKNVDGMNCTVQVNTAIERGGKYCTLAHLK
jgi:hypothetical protein